MRELKHAVERGAILASGSGMGPAALFGTDAAEEPATPVRLADFVAQSERRHIARVLEECAGHRDALPRLWASRARTCGRR